MGPHKCFIGQQAHKLYMTQMYMEKLLELYYDSCFSHDYFAGYRNCFMVHSTRMASDERPIDSHETVVRHGQKAHK